MPFMASVSPPPGVAGIKRRRTHPRSSPNVVVRFCESLSFVVVAVDAGLFGHGFDELHLGHHADEFIFSKHALGRKGWPLAHRFKAVSGKSHEQQDSTHAVSKGAPECALSG